MMQDWIEIPGSDGKVVYFNKKVSDLIMHIRIL